jgi:hypothetical protein
LTECFAPLERWGDERSPGTGDLFCKIESGCGGAQPTEFGTPVDRGRTARSFLTPQILPHTPRQADLYGHEVSPASELPPSGPTPTTSWAPSRHVAHGGNQPVDAQRLSERDHTQAKAPTAPMLAGPDRLRRTEGRSHRNGQQAKARRHRQNRDGRGTSKSSRQQ